MIRDIQGHFEEKQISAEMQEHHIVSRIRSEFALYSYEQSGLDGFLLCV